MLKRIPYPVFIAIALAGCATKGGPVVETGPRYMAATDSLENYRLSAGDKVRVTVFGEQSLSGEYAVASDGMVSIPLAGNVPADGESPKGLSDLIQTRLADGYLRDPKVSVEVVTYRPFFILGEVSAPGQYPYASGMTAMNAVALARGFTPRANRAVVRIRGEGTAAEVNYRLTPELIVRPGDTLLIGERFF